jgi:hypothetical protein
MAGATMIEYHYKCIIDDEVMIMDRLRNIAPSISAELLRDIALLLLDDPGIEIRRQLAWDMRARLSHNLPRHLCEELAAVADAIEF